MNTKQVVAATKTVLKTFLASFIGAIVMSGVGVLDMGAKDWKAAAAAGIAAVIAFAYSYLDKTDTRYGIGAE